jgi:hypothetical protein
MTTKDRGTLVPLTDISTEVAPGMKELASVSAIGPRRRNEPELTGLLHHWVVFVSSLHRKHVELSKFVAVGVAIRSTWVRCHSHSRLLVRTVLEVLVRRHGDESVLLCCDSNISVV